MSTGFLALGTIVLSISFPLLRTVMDFNSSTCSLDSPSLINKAWPRGLAKGWDGNFPFSWVDNAVVSLDIWVFKSLTSLSVLSINCRKRDSKFEFGFGLVWPKELFWGGGGLCW
ncbi:hypothetical protein LguiB_027649 [Lonicera macranthoides]